MRVGMNGRFFPNNWRPARQEIDVAARAGLQTLQFPGKPEGLNADHLGAELSVVATALQEARLVAVMEMVMGVGLDGKTREGRTSLDVLTANLPSPNCPAWPRSS